MLQYYHATHGSSHALNLFYINSLDQIQQSRGGPNKDVIDSSSSTGRSTGRYHTAVCMIVQLKRFLLVKVQLYYSGSTTTAVVVVGLEYGTAMYCTTGTYY